MVENLSYLGSQYSRVSIRLYRLILLRNPVHFLNQSTLPEIKLLQITRQKALFLSTRTLYLTFNVKEDILIQPKIVAKNDNFR